MGFTQNRPGQRDSPRLCGMLSCSFNNTGRSELVYTQHVIDIGNPSCSVHRIHDTLPWRIKIIEVFCTNGFHDPADNVAPLSSLQLRETRSWSEEESLLRNPFRIAPTSYYLKLERPKWRRFRCRLGCQISTNG